MSTDPDPPVEESSSWTFLRQPSPGSDAAGLRTPPSIGSRPSPLGGVSGESLGSDGGGGAPASDPLLAGFLSGKDAAEMCYAYMSKGQVFCVRDVKPGHGGCRYHANLEDDARMPFSEDRVFICTTAEGGTSAWVSPSVNYERLSDEMIDELRQSSRTHSVWSVLMTAIREESQDKVEDALMFGNGSVPLQVPKTAKKAKQMPKSLDEADVFPPNSDDLDPTSYPSDLIEKLNGLFRRVGKVENEVVAHQVETAADLGNLQVQVTKTDGRIGTDPPISEVPFASVWSGIRQLFFDTAQFEGNFEAALHRVSNLETTVFTDLPKLRASVTARMPMIDRHEKILVDINQPFKTMLEFVRALTPSDGSPAGASLSKRLTLLEQTSAATSVRRVSGAAEVEEMMGDPTTQVLALSSAVASLRDLVEKLEARQGSAGLFVADISFPSYMDTEAWVTLNLPGFRYGLYVDGHTLLENLMSAEHVEYSTTIDEAHKVSRSNFLSGYEARVHGSFVNILPTFFGRGPATVSLPGIPTYKDWSTGGTGGIRGGLRAHLSQKLKESRKQMASAINTRLSGGEAQEVALALLAESYDFCMGLIHFIDTFMQDLTEHGHPEKEAWTLISDCVARIYGDLSDARISGRGARDGTDDVQTASACLWATLSAHRVMREYMRLDFDRHPSVSSALTRYQTKHSANDSVVKVERRLTTIESKIAASQSKVDAFGGRLRALEKP